MQWISVGWRSKPYKGVNCRGKGSRREARGWRGARGRREPSVCCGPRTSKRAGGLSPAHACEKHGRRVHHGLSFAWKGRAGPRRPQHQAWTAPGSSGRAFKNYFYSSVRRTPKTKQNNIWGPPALRRSLRGGGQGGQLPTALAPGPRGLAVPYGPWVPAWTGSSEGRGARRRGARPPSWETGGRRESRAPGCWSVRPGGAVSPRREPAGHGAGAGPVLFVERRPRRQRGPASLFMGQSNPSASRIRRLKPRAYRAHAPRRPGL